MPKSIDWRSKRILKAKEDFHTDFSGEENVCQCQFIWLSYSMRTWLEQSFDGSRYLIKLKLSKVKYLINSCT